MFAQNLNLLLEWPAQLLSGPPGRRLYLLWWWTASFRKHPLYPKLDPTFCFFFLNPFLITKSYNAHLMIGKSFAQKGVFFLRHLSDEKLSNFQKAKVCNVSNSNACSSALKFLLNPFAVLSMLHLRKSGLFHLTL